MTSARKPRPLLPLLLVAASLPALARPLPSPALCDLNVQDLEQARCLLSPVKPYGRVGRPVTLLPVPWPRLLADQVRDVPATGHLSAWLKKLGIQEYEIGGPLDQSISTNAGGEKARYFVIHDTSIVLDSRGSRGFPAGIDGKAWSDARIQSLARKSNAHVFVGRTGQSVTAVDFGTALVTTKFEKTDREALEGLFVGVENLQPRLRDRKGIDAIAPMPGFTPAQLRRLAIVYVAASARAGRWLIPAFHAVLDSGIPDAHDDPQHFDLGPFSAALDRVLLELASDAPAAGGRS